MKRIRHTAEQIKNHRFHGVLSGRLTCINDRLILLTSWGEVPLFFPRFKTNAHYAAKTNALHNPDQLLHVYGFPKTSPHGVITAMQLVSFHRDGAEPSSDQNEVPFSYRFKPGTFWLCGRVRRPTESGLTVVKVNQGKPGPDGERRFWLVTGLSTTASTQGSKTLFVGFHDDRGALVLQPHKLITPPNQKPWRPKPQRSVDERRRRESSATTTKSSSRATRPTARGPLRA